MTTRSAPFMTGSDLREAAHGEGPLGRVGLPFATPVFFRIEDPTPPAPTPPAPTPPAPTPPAPTPPAPVPGPAPAPTPPSPTDPLAVLAAEMGRVRTGAATEAQTQATTAMLTALGFASLDEATAFVKAKREADLAAMTEADRKVAEATAAQAAADQATAAANALAQNLRVTERLVLAADLPAERREAVRAQLRVAADATPEQIDAEVDRVRKDPALAVLFTPLAPVPPGTLPAPGYVPGAAPHATPPKLGDDVAEIVKGVTARTGIK